MSTVIQAKLNYVFNDTQLPNSALTSAHREGGSDILDDGNRGLAHYGNLAIQMAMTYDAIIDKGKTLHDINTQDHWSKTKRSRAKACRLLGLDYLVVRSVRQEHQPLSDTVLDYALSALLGAIWLDCERQERTSSQIRSIILAVIRTIDAVVGEHLATESGVTDVDQICDLQCDSITDTLEPHLETLEMIHADDIDVFIRQWFDEELGDFPPEFILPLEPQSHLGEFDRITSLEGHLMEDIEGSDRTICNWNTAFGGAGDVSRADSLQCENRGRHPIVVQTEQTPIFASPNMSNDTIQPVTRVRGKRNRDGTRKPESPYDRMLQAEEKKLRQFGPVDRGSLERFLKHPTLEQLDNRGSFLVQFIYLAIGSWETIVDFRDLIKSYRCDASVYKPSNILLRNSTAMYNEICRLEKEEALCVLLRRYHILNLCEEEQLYNDCHSHIIVDTPMTLHEGRPTKPGNPVFALESGLTDKLSRKVMPDTDPQSAEFQKTRVKVKRIRKLAGRLRRLVKRYGFGILALLPSGSSFGELSLTDNVLLSMTEKVFDDLFSILHQEQGPHLHILSSILEPYLVAIATGSISSDTECFREWASSSLLMEIPKGLLGHKLLLSQLSN